MNIPYSILAPFGVVGVLGFPSLQFDDRAMGKKIKCALQDFTDDFYESYYGIQHVGSGVKIICADLKRIAIFNGATNVTCDSMVYPSQVVFAVKYQLPHSKKLCHVGVGIRISPRNKPFPH
jgi:hypothetical protein